MLAVGCPVRHREWIIERWFAHVEAACDNAGQTPVYVFAAARHDPDVEILRHLAKLRERDIIFAWTDEDPEEKPPAQRQWDAPAYARMAVLRNQLLGLVREIEPDAFLSIDSDILLHPDALGDLLEDLGRFDAVAGSCFMMWPRKLPNVAWWPHGADTLHRPEVEHASVVPADIIMALKLMSPRAYLVDYAPHPNWGEDIGWSMRCRAAGVSLGWDNRHPSKHCLERRMLYEADERLGW